MPLKAINQELQGVEASQALDRILRAGGQESVPAVSIAEARHGEGVASLKTDRQAVRVLFITTDTRLLTQATKSLDGYLTLTDLFDEVHLVVLRTGIPVKNPVLRIAPNGWLYTVTAKHRYQLPLAAWRMIQDHFVFADGFRPDLIVARDYFESALLTYAIGHHFNRPTQLYIPQYMLETKFRRSMSWWRRVMADWCTQRFVSIRTDAAAGVALLRTRFPQCDDVRALPRYRESGTLAALERSSWLKTKYPQFSFFIVLMSTFEQTGSLFPTIDALRTVLRNPRIGCIVLGNGPVLADIERRVGLLKLHEQVIFERSPDGAAEYLQSAELLVVVDGDGFGDDTVIYGVSMGCPVVAVPTTLRTDLFTEGESMLFVRPGDVAALSRACLSLFNNNVLRYELAYRAQHIVAEKLHSDPVSYQDAYRDSIEYAIIAHAPREDN